MTTSKSLQEIFIRGFRKFGDSFSVVEQSTLKRPRKQIRYRLSPSQTDKLRVRTSLMEYIHTILATDDRTCNCSSETLRRRAGRRQGLYSRNAVDCVCTPALDRIPNVHGAWRCGVRRISRICAALCLRRKQPDVQEFDADSVAQSCPNTKYAIAASG